MVWRNGDLSLATIDDPQSLSPAEELTGWKSGIAAQQIINEAKNTRESLVMSGEGTARSTFGIFSNT